MMPDPHLVRLAVYDASDGPRLMFFGPMNAPFELLQGCFRQLGGQETGLTLEQYPWIHRSGDVSVTLRSSGAKFKPQSAVDVPGIRRIGLSLAFVWHLTTEDWDELAELIDGVVSSATPCHQYLGRHSGDDVKVVVSKGEYTDDVLAL